VHRAQNGAVSVAALRSLLAKVEPQGHSKEPTAEDVKFLAEETKTDECFVKAALAELA